MEGQASTAAIGRIVYRKLTGKDPESEEAKVSVVLRAFLRELRGQRF